MAKRHEIYKEVGYLRPSPGGATVEKLRNVIRQCSYRSRSSAACTLRARRRLLQRTGAEGAEVLRRLRNNVRPQLHKQITTISRRRTERHTLGDLNRRSIEHRTVISMRPRDVPPASTLQASAQAAQKP